jgi:hypothetical protein
MKTPAQEKPIIVAGIKLGKQPPRRRFRKRLLARRGACGFCSAEILQAFAAWWGTSQFFGGKTCSANNAQAANMDQSSCAAQGQPLNFFLVIERFAAQDPSRRKTSDSLLYSAKPFLPMRFDYIGILGTAVLLFEAKEPPVRISDFSHGRRALGWYVFGGTAHANPPITCSRAIPVARHRPVWEALVATDFFDGCEKGRRPKSWRGVA